MKALKWIIIVMMSLVSVNVFAQNDFDDAYLTPSQARKMREKKEAERLEALDRLGGVATPVHAVRLGVQHHPVVARHGDRQGPRRRRRVR